MGAIDVSTKTAHLFIPDVTQNYDVWRGPPLSIQEMIKKYQISQVHNRSQIVQVLKSLNPGLLLTLKGVNADSNHRTLEARFDGIDKFQVNNSVLYEQICDLRVFKTDLEIEVLRYVIDISSEAHRNVMRFAKPGVTEFQCEAEFLHYCYGTGGCRHAAYTSICASGANTAVLHYGRGSPNRKMIEPGDMCLFDMGASYFGYCADITCSFPANGKFTPTQKLIYEAVLAAHHAVFKVLKPGVNWCDMHILAQRTLLSELKKGGILKGDVEGMLSTGLGSVFQPHGLGHFLGLDVHDVGGFIGSTRSEQKGLTMLKTTRVLQERMVITLEPGCYFVDTLLDEALENQAMAKFFVQDVIKKFRGFGGIRIEDDILITKQGAVNLTKVPRTVHEVENWIEGKDNNKYN